MEDDIFYELQRFLETQANLAWWQTQRRPGSMNTVESTMGHNLELQLQTNHLELGRILDSLAQKVVDEELSKIPHPIDFNRYVRYSGQRGYKEVFVGDKWVTVPEDTCVEFSEKSISLPNGTVREGFAVTLYREGTDDYAHLENSATMEDYEEQMDSMTGIPVGVALQPSLEQSSFWDDYGRPVLDFAERQVGFGDNVINGGGAMAGDAFLRRPGKVRRRYTYKITRQAQKWGSKIRPGAMNRKIHDLAKLGREGKLASLSKITKPLGAAANLLTMGVIADEVATDTWDAHTVADGTLLVVGIIASGAGAPVVLTGIAIYGLLDYFFDIGEGLDKAIGRDSGLWDDPVQRAPVDRETLFQQAVERFENRDPFERPRIEQDNTKVQDPLHLKPPIKN